MWRPKETFHLSELLRITCHDSNSPLESAHLAALTPNPHVLARRFRDGQVDEGWQHRLYDLLGMMKRHGRLSAVELAAARASKLVLRDLSQDVGTRGVH